MSEHPNVATVNRMTEAVLQQDRETLGSIFTDDFVFHFRGQRALTGDHAGVDGFLRVLGSIFEATNGDVDLAQQFCIAADGWATEWEHATLGRNGKKLHSQNSFIYRFDDGQIAEMWMFIGALPDDVEAFFA